ncbi:MAG: nucleotidyl transferase AbiEii/AbiGii toxin family protein [Candidatus Magasanikbacteria bacterium]
MEDLPLILKFAKERGLPLNNPKSLYVEYLQYEVLNSIFRHTDKLSFIGGTALRILFNSQRFSEDLDFDNFGITEKEFEKLTRDISKDLFALGFQVEFRNVYKGAYHCYFKFAEILQKYGFSPHADEKILVRIDTVKQDFDFSPVVGVLNNFGLFFEVRHNPKDILYSQKLLAALERKRGKGRDFYDITFLDGLTKPNLDYLNYKVGIKTMGELKERLLARCSEVDFKEMARDVEPFLFNHDDIVRITKFPQYIEGWQV